MKNTVGKGTFVLILSGLVCKFFGGLFRLPLTNIVGIEGIGIFQMVMSLYSLALVFVSGGVTNALSKLVSSARARGDNRVIGSYLRYGFSFTLSFSLLLSLVFIIFAKPISSFQGIGNSSVCYFIVALALPLGGLVGALRGILQGYANMTPTAISQIIEQVLKFVFGLIFAYLFSKGGHSGVAGAFCGILICEFFALFYLLVATKQNDKYVFGVEGKGDFLRATLPLTFGGVVVPFTHAIEGLFASKLLIMSGLTSEKATALFGVQTGIVGAILNFPLIISLALASSLLPNLSYLSASGDDEGQRKIISKSFLSMWYILLPLVFGLVAISQTLYPIIYPGIIDEYLKISIKITILSGFSIILTAIMQFLLSILQANGFFNYSLIFSIFGGIGKLSILFICTPLKQISIYALSISNIVLASIVSVCILIKIGHLISFPFYEVTLPILSSFIMYMAVKIFLSLVGGIWGLLVAVIVGMTAYFVFSLPLFVGYVREIFGKLKINIDK